jgi:hypothetical protein
MRQGFMITDRSKTFIAQAENYIFGPSRDDTKATSQTRRKESILAEVENSPAYLKYKKGDGRSISESEFCFLLQGTLDSSKEVLIGNLEALRRFAEELGNAELVKFADWLKCHFKHFLESKSN